MVVLVLTRWVGSGSWPRVVGGSRLAYRDGLDQVLDFEGGEGVIYFVSIRAVWVSFDTGFCLGMRNAGVARGPGVN